MRASKPWEWADRRMRVSAYVAAPENTVKGVLKGIPLSETPEMIRANFVHNYNGAALEAHRIGTSHAVIVRFNGNKVPAYVMYCGDLYRCRIYRQHKEVCKTCRPTWATQVRVPPANRKDMLSAGRRNRSEDHEKEGKPRCKLCGRSHPTGTGNCAKKFKTLFLLRRHEHERKTVTKRARKFGQSKVRFSGKDDFPVLLKSAQRECSNSRSESTERALSREHSANCNRQRSLSRDRAWTDVVQGGAKSEKDAKTRQPSRTPARKPRNDPLTAKMLQLESTIELMQEFMRQQQETTTSPNLRYSPRKGPGWARSGMLHYRSLEGQEGLNCRGKFRTIYNRLNRQDDRINEISQKVDNGASAMTKFEARIDARITTGFEEMKLFMVQLLNEEMSSLGRGYLNTPGSSSNHEQSN
ncbi:hypothetical protein MRX96_007282 [Rhipicephalus microplus]